MENEIKETKKSIIEYSQECPYCGFKVESIYPNQLAFNIGIHKGNCKMNPKNIKEEK